MKVEKTLRDILGVEIPIFSEPCSAASGPDLVSSS